MYSKLSNTVLSWQAILDRHIFGIIFVLLGVDVGILIVWTVLSPYSLKTTDVSRVVS